MTDGDFPPRCRHGNIILGCPEDDCPEQNEYLEKRRAQIVEWQERLQAEARRYVRQQFGLPE